MSDLLLPVDACPRCLTCPVHPYRVDRYEALGSASALYECPSCHVRWQMPCSEDALSEPCPGCPECGPPERRTA